MSQDTHNTINDIVTSDTQQYDTNTTNIEQNNTVMDTNTTNIVHTNQIMDNDTTNIQQVTMKNLQYLFMILFMFLFCGWGMTITSLTGCIAYNTNNKYIWCNFYFMFLVSVFGVFYTLFSLFTTSIYALIFYQVEVNEYVQNDPLLLEAFDALSIKYNDIKLICMNNTNLNNTFLELTKYTDKAKRSQFGVVLYRVDNVLKNVCSFFEQYLINKFISIISNITNNQCVDHTHHKLNNNSINNSVNNSDLNHVSNTDFENLFTLIDEHSLNDDSEENKQTSKLLKIIENMVQVTKQSHFNK